MQPPDKGGKIELTTDANFDYTDSIAIMETTIMILSLLWHTIAILSRYYPILSSMVLRRYDSYKTWLRVDGMSLEQSNSLKMSV